jgi:hypothetical protein
MNGGKIELMVYNMQGLVWGRSFAFLGGEVGTYILVDKLFNCCYFAFVVKSKAFTTTEKISPQLIAVCMHGYPWVSPVMPVVEQVGQFLWRNFSGPA